MTLNRNGKVPQVIDKSEEEIASLIEQIRASNLSSDDIELVIKCVESALWFPRWLESKNISIARLKSLIFGKNNKSKKTAKAKANAVGEQSENEERSAENSPLSAKSTTPPLTDEHQPNLSLNKKPGHGRMPHDVYKDSMEVRLSLNGYTVNQPCPLPPCKGTLRYYQPGVIIRVRGQNFASVTRYHVEKLRCDTCNYLVVADLPSDIGDEKYDASFKAILALQKYYVAVPFYRQESFQKLLGFRLPDSTQWDLIEQVATPCYSVNRVLEQCAANGKTIDNDDTRLKIQEVMREIKANPDRDRKGMYTSGFISEFEGHCIALFRNGTQHAGENLNEILKGRQTDKGPIIQMCDASGNNMAKDFVTIVCHCLSHGFRKFEELAGYFPASCMAVMEKISLVYRHDENTRQMTDEERLTYHQQHSQPVMEALKLYIDEQLSNRQIEPNSELAKAFRYMNKYWPGLTQFLRVPGAKLDNNAVERALKIAIRNRKSAMFYRSRYSAEIGGMLTGLLYTCHLADENPHHYLTELQRHRTFVHKDPGQWLPWNYRATLMTMAELGVCANPLEHPPPEASLAVIGLKAQRLVG